MSFSMNLVAIKIDDGYGSLAPKTNLGKAATMGYAILGIPLTLLYLSSVGSVLSRIARGVFSRALCCCLCSNCGYCCYDEKRMAEKERRMKKKRQLMELKQQQMGLQEPFYVRSGVNYNTTGNNLNNLNNLTNLNDLNSSTFKENDNLSYLEDVESKVSIHGWSILAPILLCLASMFVYICLGTFILYKLENWTVLDGFYFCFMSLTTIGFSNNFETSTTNDPKTIWFCSFYIMLGMALTAMCFNVVHDEIVHRLKHDEKLLKKAIKNGCFNDEINDFNGRFNPNS
nr:potassium channel subfamily K member 18 [Onthophagus taurus]